MSLTQFFYPLPARRRTAISVILWWEERRVPFNLIVGAAGCFTIAVVSALFALPGNWPGPPLVGLLLASLVYGVLANVCYCLGPLLEIAMYRLWGEEAPRAGPVLFRQGLIFSVGLTLFPIALAGLLTVARVVAGVLGS